jgi:hypothetical protein
MVKGFTPLGTFFLGDYFDLSGTFTELLTERGGNPEPTPQVVADLMAEIVEPTQGAFMQFFSFPVFSNEPSRVLADGRFPVWKWVKPQSIYRTNSLWEADLSQVLDQGEWNGGKDLMILVVGVTEEILEIIGTGVRKFTTLGRLVTE